MVAEKLGTSAVKGIGMGKITLAIVGATAAAIGVGIASFITSKAAYQAGAAGLAAATAVYAGSKW